MVHTWNAEDYAKNSSAQQQWALELIAKLSLQGNESVLDIGCGDGKISAQLTLAAKNVSVLGIDLSEDMIRLASEKFPAAAFPNLSFLVMDAAHIRLPVKFDAAFSNATLHWVKNHRVVLEGVHGCLKPGGKMLFQMGGSGNAADITVAIEKILHQPQWKAYFENFSSPYFFYTPEEYRVWLLETGFRPLRVELVPKDMQHQGTEGLKGWLRTTWFPYTAPLPSDLREPFLMEVVEIYTEAHPIDASGHTHVRMIRLEVEAIAL